MPRSCRFILKVVKIMTRLTPMKAIRKYCIECSGGSYKEVELCRLDDCPLFEYRFGKRPTNKSKYKKESTKK